MPVQPTGEVEEVVEDGEPAKHDGGKVLVLSPTSRGLFSYPQERQKVGHTVLSLWSLAMSLLPTPTTDDADNQTYKGGL